VLTCNLPKSVDAQEARSHQGVIFVSTGNRSVRTLLRFIPECIALPPDLGGTPPDPSYGHPEMLETLMVCAPSDLDFRLKTWPD